LKNKSQKSEKFYRSKNDRQLPTFYHQFTTKSPAKGSTENAFFAKTPCKNALPPQTKKLQNEIRNSRIF